MIHMQENTAAFTLSPSSFGSSFLQTLPQSKTQMEIAHFTVWINVIILFIIATVVNSG